PTVTYFDRKTRSQQPVPASQVSIDPLHKTVTVVFGSNTPLRLKDLRGTVFTVSVPFAVPTPADAGRDAAVITTLTVPGSQGAASRTDALAGNTSSSVALLSLAAQSANPLAAASGGGDAQQSEGGSGAASETGTLRELPQPPSALMALPSATVSPSTLET